VPRLLKKMSDVARGGRVRWRRYPVDGMAGLFRRGSREASLRLRDISSMFEPLCSPREHDCCTRCLYHPDTHEHTRPDHAPIARPPDSISPARCNIRSNLVFSHSAYQNLWSRKRPSPHSHFLHHDLDHPSTQWLLPHSLRQRQEARRIRRVQNRAQTGKCRCS
jgi:hypothetical protein